MADDLVSGIQNMVASFLSEMHTSMPGVVTSYDPATRRATVRPTLSKQLADGRVLPAPQIVSVPVIWPSAGGAGMTLPVKAGDGVMLHFSERSLEAWHDSGNAVPDDPRSFDLTDAVAVPGLNHGGATQAAHPENAVFYFGEASISITPGGVIMLHGTSIQTDTPLVSSAAIVSQGTVLHTHVHGGVQSGGANTGLPS